MRHTIRETQLPGVGVQHDFETEQGHRVGVITHHTGRRDFLVFSADDPDMCATSTNFTEKEAQILGEMLGASQVVKSINSVQQNIDGLAIDWIPVQEGWPCTNTSIHDLGLYQTGTQIIAIIRGEETIPAPEPSFRLQSNDTVVVIGKPEGITQSHDVMAGIT
jgi:TrkA domain protein